MMNDARILVAAALTAATACVAGAAPSDLLSGAMAGDLPLECAFALPSDVAREADADAGPWQFAFDRLTPPEIVCGDLADAPQAALPAPGAVPQYWVIIEDLSVPTGARADICLRDGAGVCRGGAAAIADTAAREMLAGPVLRNPSGRFPVIDLIVSGESVAEVRFAIRRILRARTSSELQGARAFLPQSETSSYNPIDQLTGSFFGTFFKRLSEATVQLYWPPRASLIAGQMSQSRSCSATLVGPRHVLTNAHCMTADACAAVEVRFDRLGAADLEAERQRRCKRVLIEGDPSGVRDLDFALFELAAPAPPVMTPSGVGRARQWFDLSPAASIADAAGRDVLVAHHPLGDRMFGGNCFLRAADTHRLLSILNVDPSVSSGLVAHGCGTQPGSSGALIAMPDLSNVTPGDRLRGVALHVAGHEIFGGDEAVVELWRREGLQPANFAIDLSRIRERILDCIEENGECE